jgi:UDP-3-O-[3-hydroxymyristoyl] glucosamine N-acyltransferase
MMSTPVTGGGEGVGVRVGVGVGVGVGVCVGVAVGVWVAVAVGMSVSVGTGEGVSVDARVGTAPKMSQAETIQISWMSSKPSQRLRLRLTISPNSHNLIPERKATPRCCAFVHVKARV